MSRDNMTRKVDILDKLMLAAGKKSLVFDDWTNVAWWQVGKTRQHPSYISLLPLTLSQSPSPITIFGVKTRY